MDPDACLEMIRKRIEWIRKAIDSNDTDTAIAEADLLATEVQALDRWIGRGGFLPKDWRK